MWALVNNDLKNYHIHTPVLHAVIESQGILGVGKLNNTMEATHAWLVSMWPEEKKPSSTSIISWLLVNEVWECQTGLWAITPPPHPIIITLTQAARPEGLWQKPLNTGQAVWSVKLLKVRDSVKSVMVSRYGKLMHFTGHWKMTAFYDV